MNRRPLYLCATVLLAARAWGDTKPAATAVANGTSKTVTIDATGSDVRDVVKSITAQTGARILIGPEVTGKLDSKLQDMPLEGALSVVAKITGNRWSKITVPADKVEALTPDQAAALVMAADKLAASAVAVQSPGGPSVFVGPPSPATPNTTAVYVVLTKTDPAAIRAARDAARNRAATKDEQAQLDATAQKLGDDARKDPNVVKAFSALQSLGPDQIAVVAREFMVNSTPEMRQAIGEALRNQRDQIRTRMQQQQQQQ